MQVTQSFTLPHPWETVEKVLLDPEFNTERELLREGTIRSEFVTTHEREQEMLFELHTTEYKRKKTGGLDTSGTVLAVTKCRYDRSSRRLSWTYHGEGGNIIQLAGVYRLDPRGDTTVFTHDVTIEVKIPLIGKKIAKMIAKQFEREDDRYPKLWERFLAKE